jgi:hypothetical protein
MYTLLVERIDIHTKTRTAAMHPDAAIEMVRARIGAAAVIAAQKAKK